MPDWLRITIGWTLAVVALASLAALSGLITVFFGFAWGIIAGAAAAYGVARLAATSPDGGGAVVAIFGWAALIVGFIVGGLWRLLA